MTTKRGCVATVVTGNFHAMLRHRCEQDHTTVANVSQRVVAAIVEGWNILLPLAAIEKGRAVIGDQNAKQRTQVSVWVSAEHAKRFRQMAAAADMKVAVALRLALLNEVFGEPLVLRRRQGGQAA